MISFPDKHISIHPEVRRALADRIPVVALESTVITHGLPFPENKQIALGLETEVRARGCVPATIAILDGMIWIGLEPDQIEQLAQGKDFSKISSRDLAPAVIQHASGGTTVAGTLTVAQLAGIKVFSTGGIGGVHREAPFDVSADLVGLAHSRLVVVCAGAKAILDIPATLEVLETYGIPVVGYQTDEFPAFYSTTSGYRVPARADSPEEVAELAVAHWGFGQDSAILLAVPPAKEAAIERDVIESAIQQALSELQERKIHGQAVTPFLLSRVSALTGGKSLTANLALLRNNARVAAEVAQVLTSLAKSA